MLWETKKMFLVERAALAAKHNAEARIRGYRLLARVEDMVLLEQLDHRGAKLDAHAHLSQKY